MDRPNSCIFCRIAEHKAPASFVYEDDAICAFLDIQPVTEGHVLVVPKCHAESLLDLPVETAKHMMEVAYQVIDGLRDSSILCEGVSLFLADGDVAGQEVPHVHLHVIPRTRGDGFGLHLPAAYGRQPPREDLDRTAQSLRDGLLRVHPSTGSNG
jgi:diadenosine tetraphosphate (Ap4A) HIT family hydrolase